MLQHQQIRLKHSLTLIKVTSDHAGQLYDLMQRIYPESYGHMWYDQGIAHVNKTYCHQAVEVDLQQASTGYWIVESDETVVGILRVLWEAPHTAVVGQGVKLHRIYLDPDYSGSGIGGAVMKWLLTRAADMGAGHIWLETMETAHDARRFYSKHNFTAVEKVRLEEAHIHPDHEMMIQMVCRINPTL